MKLELIAFRVDPDVLEMLDALSARLGVGRSEIIRRFLVAGVEANPLAPTELAAYRAKRAEIDSGRVPGLVIPLSPMARAETTFIRGRLVRHAS